MVEQINDTMLVYHGGSEIVENPEIIIGRYKKDFYWDIGAVYQRLIEGLESENIIDKLIEVYNSWITEYIDNYNIAVYYMTPQYLKLSYEEGELIE